MDIKKIIERVNKLTPREKLHILSILKNNNVDFTKNINGYFFNLVHVNDCVLSKLDGCLDLIEKNRDLIKEMDKRRLNLLKYYKTLINDTLNQNIQNKIDKHSDFIKINNDWTNMKLQINKKKYYRYTKLYNRQELDGENLSNKLETLYKEYHKTGNKYNKNSVYYRIFSIIKSKNLSNYENSSNLADKPEYTESENENLKNTETFDDQGIEGIEGIEGMDSIEGIEGTDLMHETEEEHEETEEENTSENEEDEDDNETIEEDNGEEELSNKNEENDNIDEENDNIEETDEIESEMDEETKKQLLFFKSILNKRGYEFDDDKNCFLIVEEYI